MFYLIQFFKFVHMKGWCGYLFLFFTLALVLSSLTYFPVNQEIRKRFQVEKPLPYFHALVTTEEDMATIMDTLSNIIGVAKIETKQASHLQDQAKELLSDLGLQELYQDESYLGLQIFLDPDPERREQTYLLVKEYMARALGKHHVSFSTLKYPKTTVFKTKKASIQFLHQWGHPLFLLMMGLFWFLSLLSIGSDFRSYCYLIEEYQRRKNISFKVMMMGLWTLIGFSFGTFVFLEDIHFYSVMGTALFMVIFAGLLCLQKRWN